MNRLQYIENGIFLRSCIEGNDKIMALSTNHFSLLLKKWQIVFLIMVMGIALPFWSGAQVSAGVIGKSQCITSGGTPSAFTSLRHATGSGIVVEWQKSTVSDFSSGVTGSLASTQGFTEGSVAGDTYYRRKATSGLSVAFSNIIKVSVYASFTDPVFTPTILALPEVCQKATSFSVAYTTNFSPDKYSIIWSQAAITEGFQDVQDAMLPATPNSLSVSVPAAANSGTFTGTLIATISTTGCTTSNVSAVKINALPVVPTISGITSFCNGGSSTLTSSSATGNLWSTGATTQSITVNSAGSYSVTVTNGNSCSASSTNTNVTINALPVVPTISGVTSFCNGGSSTLTSSSATGNLWSTGATTQSISVNSAGSYSVTVTNGNNCSASSTNTNVTVNSLPAVPTISGATSFCTGGSTTLTSSSVTGNLWSTGATTQSITVNSAGSYSVTVTNGNSCSASSTNTNVTINALPVVPTISGVTSFCNGGSSTLTSSSATGNLWSTGATTQSISVNSAGSYSVTVTNGSGCSSSSATTNITINPLPVVTIITPSPICAPGIVDLTLSAVTAGSTLAQTFTYFTNSANTNILSAPSAVNTSGTYYIKGTAIATGCAVSKAVVVSINPQPVVVINTPAVVCAPATINLTANAITAGSDAGLTFTRWTNAVATLPLANDNAVAVSGTYYIKGSLATGCAAILPVSVTINPPPSVVINNPAAVCTPGTIDLTQNIITLNSTAGLAFTRWTNAAATIPLINETAVNTSGTYFIKGLLSTTGCAAVKPVSVIINPLPNGIVQTPTVNYICEGSSVLLTASVSGQYQWYADQQMIAGATNANYTAVKAGTYTVQFTSNEGCVAFAGNSIRLYLLSKSVLSFTPDSKCVGTQITFTNLSVFANSGGISWLWDFGDGASSNGISPLHLYTKPGTYNIKLIANNIQCNNLTDSKTMVLTIEQPLPGIAYASVNAFAGTTVTLQARTFGIQYLWQPNTGLSSATIPSPVATVSENKIYTVSITSTAGCITTDTVQVKLINSAEIFLPQGFTPNGDGQNDKLYPILVGIGRLSYFKIFNRWGNLVFQTNDAAPANGWTGKFNGTDQPPGTYVWIAEAVDVNGNTIKRSGNVLLIR